MTFVSTPHLNGGHVVFGKVTEGLDMLEKMEAVGSRAGQTRQPVWIEDCGEVTEETQSEPKL